MLPAGEKDHKIVIQRLGGVAKDTFGHTPRNLSTLATVWAKYLSGGGKEIYTDARIHAQTEGRFQINPGIDVKVTDTIVDGTVTFNVLAVDLIKNRTVLEIRVVGLKA